MSGTAATPAASHLFEVNENGIKLSIQQSDFFHHNVAKLFFLCKRARPDIQTAVAFLCTREPDDNDYKKLVQLMQYIRGTRELKLTRD